MATVNRDKSGWRVLFSMSDGRPRKTLRPGVNSRRQAESIARHIDSLLAAKLSGTPLENATAKWLSTVPQKLYAKLEHVGLAPKKASQEDTLADLFDLFVSRGETKRGNKAAKQTVLNWQTAIRRALSHWSPGTRIRSIEPRDAEAYYRSLAMEQEVNSARKNVAVMKLIFDYGVKIQSIESNPFKDVTSSSVTNRTKDYFVTRETYEKVLAACPTKEWKLLLSLARYGGLRVPSEIRGMRWEHFKEDRIVVYPTKTAHHENLTVREVPLFPEIEFEKGEGPVFRMSLLGLPTKLKRIIKKAGLEPWPKIFQNMRATRRTELQREGYQNHVLNCWLGHSTLVAEQHYLQVGDGDFEKAARPAARLTGVKKVLEGMNRADLLEIHQYVGDLLEC